MQVSWLAVRLRTSRLGAWRSTSAEETRGRRVWGARLHAIPCLAPHLRFRLRACALAPATQEHGAAGGTSRQRDHTEVWDALIGSVAAATATMVQPTGSSEQPAQYGERRGERATSFRRVIWTKVGSHALADEAVLDDLDVAGGAMVDEQVARLPVVAGVGAHVLRLQPATS